MQRLIISLCALSLAACVPTGGRGGGGGGSDDDEASQNLRPDDAPDYLVISVSGHCFLSDCPPESYSPEYLERGGSLEAIASMVAADGNEVHYISYGDSLYTYRPEDGWDPGVYGFLDLTEDLAWVYENWIEGVSNPTQLIVIAHSHGTVWSHTALHLMPEVPVLLLVDLDGESLGWESDSWTLNTLGDDWASETAEFYEANRSDWPMSVFWSFDIWNAANSWDIPGMAELQDVEDVVPHNVVVNVETASTSSVLQDAEWNHRPDGSQTDIYRFQAEFDEHHEVDDLGSETMDWLLERLYGIDWAALRDDIDN
jgi:hypothetical protein